MSRKASRFSYSNLTSSPLPPSSSMGQSSFWDNNPRNPNRPMSPPQPMYYAKDEAPPAPGHFTKDEKTLLTVLGVGIIVALLIDAVAHTKQPVYVMPR